MQIKEKMHVPVTICFPDYAFNEYAHISFFQKWFFFKILLLKTDHMDRHKNLRISLLWVLRKKETLARAIFGKICYVACMINCAGK